MTPGPSEPPNICIPMIANVDMLKTQKIEWYSSGRQALKIVRMITISAFCRCRRRTTCRARSNRTARNTCKLPRLSPELPSKARISSAKKVAKKPIELQQMTKQSNRFDNDAKYKVVPLPSAFTKASNTYIAKKTVSKLASQ